MKFSRATLHENYLISVSNTSLNFAESLREEGRLHLTNLTLSEASELYLRNFLKKYVQSVKDNIKERFLDAVLHEGSLDFLSMVVNKSNNLQSTASP